MRPLVQGTVAAFFLVPIGLHVSDLVRHFQWRRRHADDESINEHHRLMKELERVER